MSLPTPHLVDEILEEIFLRLPTPAALARASTASARFRRIITERSFLRRYRKLHRPPLLGFTDKNSFHPAQAPHPSAPLARALAAAADFTYSFVPKPANFSWIPCNARDGRVLLERSPYEAFTRLAVCDPLSRRYVLLPPIPEDLAVPEEEKLVEIQSMLAPMGEDEDETSFKVICPAHYTSKLVTFAFSSITGNWCIAVSRSWSSLGTPEPEYTLADYNHVQGCFYWTELWTDKFLVLDTRSMEFSTINILKQPIEDRCGSSIVVGRGEGALEMFSLVADQGTFAVYHTVQQRINDESSMEWRLEKIIPLPGHLNCFTSGAAEGLLFLGVTTYTTDELNIGKPLLRTDFEEHYFTLEVQTSETMEICRKMGMRTLFDDLNVYWYFGYPPSLSKPSI